jgi:hypothetical protein
MQEDILPVYLGFVDRLPDFDAVVGIGFTRKLPVVLGCTHADTTCFNCLQSHVLVAQFRANRKNVIEFMWRPLPGWSALNAICQYTICG